MGIFSPLVAAGLLDPGHVADALALKGLEPHAVEAAGPAIPPPATCALSTSAI